MSKERRITPSSGNVFADLGFPDPEAMLAKSKLAQQITRTISSRGWSQQQAAAALGIGQPKVSDLARGRLSGYSTDRLIHLLNLLDQDVAIAVMPKPPERSRAGVSVSIAPMPMATTGVDTGNPRGTA